MKVTDFLKGREVERQAVTRYINRHEEIFKGHTEKVGKEIELDSVAVEELEKVYPLPKPVTLINGVPHEEFIRVQNELIMAQKVVGELQNRLLEAQEQIATAKAICLAILRHNVKGRGRQGRDKSIARGIGNGAFGTGKGTVKELGAETTGKITLALRKGII